MTGQIAARVQLSLAGALGGFLLWATVEAAERGRIGDYAALVLTGLVLTGFGGLMAMAGPLGLRPALTRALGLGAVAAGLVWLTALRYDDAAAFLANPMQALAGFVVAALPVPFLVAARRSRWNDYAALFREAWSIALRLVAALAFVALVWLAVFLSDQVLRIVGITVIDRVINLGPVALVLSGAALGLGMAVIHDMTDAASPQLVLRILRLFLPVVLAVMAVFLAALPMRGLDGLTGGLSPVLLLLTMVAAGISLVSIVVDQSDAEAVQSVFLRRAAMVMALVLPVFAGLALWAIWLRTAQHGWTPERLFITLVAGVGLAYGLVYALAVLRGAGWMERIRQGNIRVILGVLVLAALWMTPILNAEAISAGDQLRRYEDGRLPVAALDLRALRSWGQPGAAALTRLQALAEQPGHEALADLLAGVDIAPPPDPLDLATQLAALMPVQPATATGTRDTLLQATDGYLLQDWLTLCSLPPDDGSPACLMLVADLIPARPGEEAILLLRRGPDYVEVAGLFLNDRGFAEYRLASRPDGQAITADEAARMLRSFGAAPPPVTPALLNQLGTGESGLILVP